MMAKSIRDIVNKDGRKVTRSQYVPLNRQVEKNKKFEEKKPTDASVFDMM